MYKRFCPNCGHPLKSGQIFCENCGYNLRTHQIPKYRQIKSRRVRHSNQMMDSYPMPSRHHNMSMIVIIVLLIIIITGGGYMVYNHIVGGPKPTQQQNSQNTNSNSQNNNDNETSSTQSTPEIPQNAAMNIFSNVFDDAQGIVNNTSYSGMASYFNQGSSNGNYKMLHDWAMDQNGSSSLYRVDINVASVSSASPSSDGTSKVACHVHYRFKYRDSIKHQIFVWYGKFKKFGDQWKLVSLKPDNNPVSNY